MSSITAAPLSIKHNITPERTVICYVDGDSDSLSVAQYYKQQRDLPANNLIPLPCVSGQNIIPYEQFRDQIEIPLLEEIKNRDIWAIILGYNVPHIFTYNGENYSISSFLHTLGKKNDDPYVPPSDQIKRKNHTFDRKTFKFFDEIDLTELYITSVIDGPTKKDAINLIKSSIFVDNQNFVGGQISLDPYGLKSTENQLNYQQEILDFIQYDISYLGSEYTSTYDIDDPYQDPIIHYLQDDSFYWGWKEEIASITMFKDSRTPRAFLYNADDDGASNIKLNPLESGKWLNIGLQKSNPGYASSAGMVSIPDNEECYLQPRPFFETLHQGAGLGEAFLSSTKYVNYKLILVGDPLMCVDFPLGPTDVKYPVREIIYLITRSIEDYLSRIYRLYITMTYIVNLFLYYPDFLKNDIFYANKDWMDSIGNYDVTKNYISSLMVALIRYQNIATGTLFNEWLISENVLVSKKFRNIFNSLSSQTINESQTYDDGYWEIDFIYTHSKLTLEDVNFAIEIATDPNFNDVIYLISSLDSKNGWLYEKEIGIFNAMPNDGFPSNYSGRRTRFQSPNNYYLPIGGKYYYKIYIDDSSAETVITSTEKII